MSVPPPIYPEDQFQLRQQWECVVTQIDRGEFVAVMHDLTNPRLAEEEATFSREEVAEGDESLLVPGSVFYWSIGYRVTAGGSKQRVSMIRFRRLPAWTRREIETVQQRADELFRFFGIDT